MPCAVVWLSTRPAAMSRSRTSSFTASAVSFVGVDTDCRTPAACRAAVASATAPVRFVQHHPTRLP